MKTVILSFQLLLFFFANIGLVKLAVSECCSSELSLCALKLTISVDDNTPSDMLYFLFTFCCKG